MEIILYIAMAVIGVVFGSFFTLAVYRIPKKENIVYKRSFCPNCGHRLEFLDLIPVFSYIFLKGKCRYCKDKIRPRYLILEILSGLVFVTIGIESNINLMNLKIFQIINLIYILLIVSSLFIIAGIDREEHTVSEPVFIFGIIVNILYFLYLCILKINIFERLIYLAILLLTILIEKIIYKRKHNKNYALKNFELCIYLSLLTNSTSVIISIILTLWIIVIKQMLMRKNKNKEYKIPIAYYLCITNIIIMLIQNFSLK